MSNFFQEKSISSKPVIGGSDAHFQEEIGKIKMESKVFIEDINDLIEAIKKNGFRFIF
ncbi:MAG: PHP-associated domain-containing protein [Candidatus Helarchaeota archaeon]